MAWSPHHGGVGGAAGQGPGPHEGEGGRGGAGQARHLHGGQEGAHGGQDQQEVGAPGHRAGLRAVRLAGRHRPRRLLQPHLAAGARRRRPGRQLLLAAPRFPSARLQLPAASRHHAGGSGSERPRPGGGRPEGASAIPGCCFFIIFFLCLPLAASFQGPRVAAGVARRRRPPLRSPRGEGAGG